MMTQHKMSTLSRWLLIIAAAGLVFVLFTPMWRIELDAPQYPEGLCLKIYANDLKGNVDIINGLNHYIGMKTLHKEDFIEFTVLPYIIVFFAMAYVLVSIVNKRKWLHVIFFLFIGFGIIAMADFWRWEYEYGHNLNPNAAIVVPDMAYQPPLIGFKQLLNFGAFSVPDTGGWIFISVGLLTLLCVVLEGIRHKKFKKKFSAAQVIISILLLFVINGCSTKPEPLKLGVDNCHFCKMTITDIRFGGELITKKGKIFKFDDIHCLQSFLKMQSVEQKDISGTYLSDFSSGNHLVSVKEAQLLQSEELRSPMNGNIAAFSSADSMKKVMEQYHGRKISWNELIK